jgi:hypothetical protein
VERKLRHRATTPHMTYLSRPPRPRAGSAELLGLVVVLAAGAATFWWAGHRIGVDLSAMTSVATVLGVRNFPSAGAAKPATVQAAAAEVTDQPAVNAPFCQPGQSPAFGKSLAALRAQLGDVMGTPVECEHPSSADGDTLQQTTTGLAVYSSASNTATFTDGWRHSALRNGTVVSWEGTESTPPTQG